MSSANPIDGPSCPDPRAPPVPVTLATLAPSPCPYLPGRNAKLRAFYARQMQPELYHDFLNSGFRRTGLVVYQPVCDGCRACQTIRVPVDDFTPNKSMRRCRRRNDDLTITIDEPQLTEEKYDLYRRYVEGRHPGDQDEDIHKLRGFLYESPIETIEFTYRDGTGRLLAVGICDVCSRSISSVYFFFDPAGASRGLGNFGALMEIDYARQLRIPYWYPGFWVKGCRAMEYKSSFRPCELLQADGSWKMAPY